MTIDEFAAINQKRINITGVPGAGKTSFAGELSRHLFSEKFLYLSFGRENTLNAMRSLPNNVVASSFHAFARKQLNITSERIINYYSMTHAQASLSIFDTKRLSPKLLEAFCVMMDTFVTSGARLQEAHRLFKKNRNFPPLTAEDKQEIVSLFKACWLSIWAPNSSAPVTHDMYLKEFSLGTHPVHYSRILIDETQDLNDAMIAMANMLGRSSPNTQMISFGDPCQQIFGFRGASEQFISTKFDFMLNQTYRFGQDLCELINQYMEDSSIRYYTPIHSATNHTLIKNSPSTKGIIDLILSGEKLTFLARFNTSLWALLKKLVEKDITYCMLGGGQKKELAFLRQLYELKCGRKQTRGPLQHMTYGTFKQKSSETDDVPSILACKFVESVGENADELFRKMEQLYTSKEKAQILLSTIHQAKGMQFKHLVLSNDLPFKLDDTGRLSKAKREDCHLVYTAMSRAISTLYLPSNMHNYYRSVASQKKAPHIVYIQ